MSKHPKNRKNSIRNKKPRRILIVVTIILFIVVVGGWLVNELKSSEPKGGKEVIFKIQEGESLAQISSNLEDENIIGSSLLFKLSAVWNGLGGDLKAGTYRLSSNMNINQVIIVLAEGKVIEKTITVKEGWNLEKIADALEEKNLVNKERFLKIAGFGKNEISPGISQKFSFLKDKSSLEGYLFPDQYKFKPGISSFKIISEMVNNFLKHTKELREKTDNFYKKLIMASILPREVTGHRNQRIVAGILWKRLNHDWPLQVDATLTYTLKKSSRELTEENLEIDSPYNTYKYKGLPPTPISNPGVENIKAALYHINTSYWYFLSTPSGKTIFSRTLRQHNISKARYLR